jgi:hypothetical protein
VNGSGVERVAGLLTGDSTADWPPAKMYTTANDYYTGERLVVSQAVARRNNIPLAHGAAASSSLPGVIGPDIVGPTLLYGWRNFKDLGAHRRGRGVRRALVITLTNDYEGSLLSGTTQYSQGDRCSASDRYPDDADHRRHAPRREPTRSQADRIGTDDRLRARQCRKHPVETTGGFMKGPKRARHLLVILYRA